MAISSLLYELTYDLKEILSVLLLVATSVACSVGNAASTWNNIMHISEFIFKMIKINMHLPALNSVLPSFYKHKTTSNCNKTIL